MITKLYNICANTGKFTDRNGNTKNRYVCVGSVLKGKYGFPEQGEQANARLIAAAPEMYKGLMECLDFIEDIISRNCDCSLQLNAEGLRDTLEELLARIGGKEAES